MGRTPARARPRTSRLFSSLRRLLLVLLTLVLIARLTNFAESLFYGPTRDTGNTAAIDEDIWFTNAEGLRLHGWFMRARNLAPGTPAPAVLHVHGNAGNIAYHDSFSRFLTESGFHVFIFDYRRYGRSDDQGPLNRDALLRDTHAALDALLAHPDVDTTRVGVYGVSLGGAFAIPLAAQRPEVRALVTLSAFSSWTGVANDHAPLLGSLLLPRGWNPEHFVPDLAGRPWLIAHGDADRIVRIRHAHRLKSLADLAGVDATLLAAPGADHNEILSTHPEVRIAIAEFLSRLLDQQ
ncbi:MAG: alpha/beta fold hydrolase [Phycisphaerales bacterium]|nr:alpha/beta fold hydrolase [Phycisphaerales bacterium]